MKVRAKHCLLLLLLLIMPVMADMPPDTPVAADVPLAVICGPASTPVGELCVFDASGSTGAGYDWNVSADRNTDGRWEIVDDGQRLVFASPEPGKYKISLSVAIDGQSDLVEWILGNGKEPGPDPDPDPGPDPPLPPDNKWQIVIVYESSTLGKLSPEQQSVIKSLTFRKRLAKAGHLILPGGIFDKDGIDRNNQVPKGLAPFVAAVRDTKLPVLCIAPVASGPVKVFPLPADEDAVIELLGGEKP